MNCACKLNDFVVNVLKCERILDVLVDNNFSFRDHVNAFVKKPLTYAT